MVEEINAGNDEIKDQLWKIGSSFIRSSEVSCQVTGLIVFQNLTGTNGK